MPNGARNYSQNVFINCPFDADYDPIFRALVFTIFACGLRPRCALEVDDASEARIEKIARIIKECRWGVHDISRTELSSNGLPRFNMPLELGMFLGARRFGDRAQKQKSCVVLDTDRYRFQQYISDLAGQDIKAHGGETVGAIKAVRAWLASRPGVPVLPGTAAVARMFAQFEADLPLFCVETNRDLDDLTFTELADAASNWLTRVLA